MEHDTVSPPLARSLAAALGMMSVLGVLLAGLELALIAPTVAAADRERVRVAEDPHDGA